MPQPEWGKRFRTEPLGWQMPCLKASSMLAKIGEYSYSIYLLHMFFVFSAARFIHEEIMDISNFYTALAWALASFGLMLPIAGASYRIIEMPFMKWRQPYIRAEQH